VTGTTVAPAAAANGGPTGRRAPGVVICGSFRRGLTALRRDFDALVAARCEILSPTDITFVRETDGFVFAAHEEHLGADEIERAHVAALRTADFVWLHAPDGYLGPSGAFELGIAASAGIPVFARSQPRDVALASYVEVVASPELATDLVRREFVADPGAGVLALQNYYRRAACDRGWEHEGPLESMVLLTEEIGELARAVREAVGLARGHGETSDVGAELADVQLYVVHLANTLGIDLAAAVTRKEGANEDRFGTRAARSA